MPEKTDNPTEVMIWKKSILQMENDTINILVKTSIEKDVIKEEKDLTMNF